MKLDQSLVLLLLARRQAYIASHIEKDANGCWIWRGEQTRNGYGRLRLDSSHNRTHGWITAHRAVFLMDGGTIPEDYELDHLCKVRLCVNPSHLEPVTKWENKYRSNQPSWVIYRSGACARGHARTPENNWTNAKSGTWKCRLCQPAWKANAAKKRALAGAAVTSGTPSASEPLGLGLPASDSRGGDVEG